MNIVIRKPLAVLVLASACLFINFQPSLAHEQGSAVASWYGPRFHGRYMASGIRFDMYHPGIVAHKTLPLGTLVLIRKPEKGKEKKDWRSIVVIVLDRGPYIKGRSFDLSYAAARALGIVGLGVTKVQFEVLHKPEPR